jgi:hypothetical protein
VATSSTSLDLANALGPDNSPHTTEIDTMPCAGVRIPTGPLTGLLAWRLVVGVPKSKRRPNQKHGERELDMFPSPSRPRQSLDESRSGSPSRPPRMSTPSFSESGSANRGFLAAGPVNGYKSKSSSALSLPMNAPSFPPSNDHHHQPTSVHGTQEPTDANTHVDPDTTFIPDPIPTYRSHLHPLERRPRQLERPHPQPHTDYGSVVTNFILDTSLPQNLISPFTLLALGLHPPHPYSQVTPDDYTVTLLVQNIPITFQVAKHGEASRLGVRFLEEANVSLGIESGGRGGVLYRDAGTGMRDAPRTVSLTKTGLQARVMAMLGLGRG